MKLPLTSSTIQTAAAILLLLFPAMALADTAPLTLPDLDTRSSWYRQAFITRRTAIECPPRTHVVQNDHEKRRLHFFDPESEAAITG